MNRADQADSTAANGSSGGPSDSTWTDIRNWLSFLIAGFGAVLTFVGFRSAEVSTVLRNDPVQVAVVAATLLLGILAAVYSLVIDRTDSTPILQCIAIFGFLAGAALLMVFATPIQVSRGNISELVYLSIGGILVIIFVIVWFIPIVKKKCGRPTTNRQNTFIAVSVVLIGISIFGAMRTETDSQLSPAVQVGGDITDSASKITVSAHVSGVKLGGSRYVEIQILGLPSDVSESKQCKGANQQLVTASCTESPCTAKYLRDQCQLILNGTVQPDVNGDVNETVSNGLVPGKYQDIAIVGLVCNSRTGCDPLTEHGSRLDLRIPTPARARHGTRHEGKN